MNEFTSQECITQVLVYTGEIVVILVVCLGWHQRTHIVDGQFMFV